MTRDAEAALADALGDEGSSKEAVLELIERGAGDERWVLEDRWAALARDTRLPAWRRLAACHVLISRCVEYPCPLATFINEYLVEMGVHRSDIVDATILQNVPVERQPDEHLLLARVPISTSVGPAAIYLAVDGDRRHVTRSAVFPSSDG